VFPWSVLDVTVNNVGAADAGDLTSKTILDTGSHGYRRRELASQAMLPTCQKYALTSSRCWKKQQQRAYRRSSLQRPGWSSTATGMFVTKVSDRAQVCAVHQDHMQASATLHTALCSVPRSQGHVALTMTLLHACARVAYQTCMLKYDQTLCNPQRLSRLLKSGVRSRIDDLGRLLHSNSSQCTREEITHCGSFPQSSYGLAYSLTSA
jgi:hypothetical protein